MLELLSPAGDLECLMSAVDYGCDAVYLGSTMFGKIRSRNVEEWR